MYRLSKTSGSTIGLAFLIARASSEPEGVGAYVAGVHMGHTVYFQGLAGLVSGPKELSPDPVDGTIDFSTTTSLGLGGALGLHLEFTKVLGLNTEIYLAKGFESEGAVGGVLIGPTLQVYKDASGAPETEHAAPPARSEKKETGRSRTNRWRWPRQEGPR